MGSKRSMLGNGLGRVLSNEVQGVSRFVDLFAGSGSVSWFVAQNFNVPVIATDLQEFATVLAKAVICRTKPISNSGLMKRWKARTTDYIEQNFKNFLKNAKRINNSDWTHQPMSIADRAKELCNSVSTLPITQAYGGYYFSPLQSLYIDAFRATVSTRKEYKWVMLAALIQAASRCAAAPGHTAQPLKATPTGASSLFEAWKRDISIQTERSFEKLMPMFARKSGQACVADAVCFAEHLRKNDLVFIDPPYSGVHYSRFYHVLGCVDISG